MNASALDRAKMPVWLGWDPANVPLILDMQNPLAQHLVLVDTPELLFHVTGQMEQAVRATNGKVEFVMVRDAAGLRALPLRLWDITEGEVVVVFHDCDGLLVEHADTVQQCLKALLAQGADAHVHVVVSVSDEWYLGANCSNLPRISKSMYGAGYTLLAHGNEIGFALHKWPVQEPEPFAWAQPWADQETEMFAAAKQAVTGEDQDAAQHRTAWLLPAAALFLVVLVAVIYVQWPTRPDAVIVGVGTGIVAAFPLAWLLAAIFSRRL